jgi:ribonuclease HI
MSKKEGSKFAVIVKADEGRREFVHGVPDDFTLNKIELLAVKFAIIGGNDHLVITTPNAYVHDMMKKDENGNWIKNPKSNAELVVEIRNLIKDKDIQILCEKSEEAKDLCSK